jgi:rhodanese-related sulfurtransferase
MARRTINQLLDEARARFRRVTPEQAFEEMNNGAALIDTRSRDLHHADGSIPGAVNVPLSVLEWRLDPESESRVEELADVGRRVILICAEGYSSSLAAARLHDMGFTAATDVIGGFRAWKEAGLPVERSR